MFGLGKLTLLQFCHPFNRLTLKGLLASGRESDKMTMKRTSAQRDEEEGRCFYEANGGRNINDMV
jgi:hypothetical protein